MSPSFPEESGTRLQVTYPGLSQAGHLAFAMDGALWAVTSSGIVRWNVEEGSVRLIWRIERTDLWITDLLASPDGTIWAATNQGVVHYDGVDWQMMTVADGLRENNVTALEIDGSGGIWALSINGLSRWDGTRWEVLNLQTNGAVYKIAAEDDQLWLADASTIGHYNLSDGTLQRLPSLPIEPLPTLALIEVDNEGVPWVYVTYKGLFRLEDQAWKPVELPTEVGVICDLAFDAANSPWLVTCSSGGIGVLHSNQGRWASFSTQNGLLTNDVRAVATSREGSIAIATGLGIQLYEEGQWRILRSGPNLPITTITVAPNGVVWMASDLAYQREMRSGIVRFDGTNWEYVDPADLPAGMGASVSLLRAAADGSIWAASGCTLGRWDGEYGWQLIAGCNDLNANVFDIAFAADGSAWVTTGFGIYRYAAEALELISDRLVTQIEFAADGTPWVSGWKGTENSSYIAHYADGKWHEYLKPNMGNLLGITGDGRVWAVEQWSLIYFEGSNWHPQPSPINLAEVQLCSWTVDGKGALWLGTTHGAFRYLTGQWQSAIPANEAVCPIAFAQDGTVWFATGQGVGHMVMQ